MTNRWSTVRRVGLVLAMPALGLGLAGCEVGETAAETAAATVTAAGEQQATTARQVADAFTAEGLPDESPRPMTKDDYGLAPYVGEGVRFLIPSLGDESGGRVFTGPDADLRKLKSYYDDLGRESAALYSWTFLNEPAGVLVQINGDLPESEAVKYEVVVRGL